MTNQTNTILKNVFGYDNFRPLQEEIINRTLEGKDSFVLMPTGGGKSMCFQIPALIFNGITIVVSPLISLMKDQVQALKSNGIKADFFNSSISVEEENNVINKAINGELQLLYLSPEKLITVSNSWLKQLNIKLVAIDEAHCVSMWGHDFRPEYTQLKIFRNSLPNVPFMALTATADKSARKDIEAQLGLRNSKLFISSFDRKNLSIEVRGQVTKKKKLQEIITFIKRRKNESGIIYCLSRKNTEEVANYLQGEGHNVAFYHAGMSNEEREKTQTDFINDETKIIVATIAFGMGIDKSNVRFVIHYNLPKNLEGYYQEIGRAGRDGLPSETMLYYNMRDFVLYSQFADDGANTAMQKEKLNRMLQFAEAKSCRRKILLSYFGEHLTENCGNCDVCENPPKDFDGTILSQKALSGIARMKEKDGITMLINVLRGSNNADIHSNQYFNLKTYGIGKEISFFDWRDYVIQMANQGLIEIMYAENSALKITPIGWQVLKGQKKIRLTTPISPNDKKKKQKIVKTTVLGDVNNDLFTALKKLRHSIAKEENMPAYIVFNDKTLKLMASEQPTTENEFLAISGVGMSKMEKYGDDFMNVIREFNNVAKPRKTPTTQKTFDLYKQGLNPKEIAEKRELSVTTIFSHLSQLYSEGKDINLEKYVSEEIIDKVRIVFNQLNRKQELKPIYEKLNEEVSYSQIRIGITLILKNE
ncbi:DNA helicase RecQ [Polaribacter reichenbachii]|uniref:DNA helicase RecQ n=1 Tax=Polaribacter reichenbachii TaxID=996801 RepID=A0A1B8TW92_9FLAO|nr:DNA helicase RecQ [Polaribacter reichenbachii]APZ45156.1 DNA helicase RecQ [Polaribacter reichenbachii]AUC19018.1 DNA helicase RecQ [Polaribacter reichenbachii]OBY63824.1 ATP-dependent DNA helicase RecQ [Polaribacter reichenbachii]